MVHLGQVTTDKEVEQHKAALPDFESLSIGEDEFTASVYGSKFAACDLPRHDMPDNEMPREVAYRMIKDDLTLDGTPTLK